MSADDDMTPEEFDEAWEKAEPCEVVIPEGGIKRSRPKAEATGTYASGRSYNFRWSLEHGFQRLT